MDTPITVTARYTEGSVSQNASVTLTISAAPATLTSLAIVGARGNMGVGETLVLAAESGYSNGSGKRVTAKTWSVSDSHAASIAVDGTLIAKTVTRDTPVVVSATYAEGDITLTTKYSVIIQAVVETPKLVAEVIATQTDKNLGNLQMWFNSEVGSTVRGSGKKLKVWVAAHVPAGPLVASESYFLLNRSKEWQALVWPLAEFLSGVNQGEWKMIELLHGVDLSIISGADVLVGYGESQEDMLNNQRYRVAYQVP